MSNQMQQLQSVDNRPVINTLKILRIIKATDFFDVFFIAVVLNNRLENDVDKIDEFIEVAESLASKLFKFCIRGL